VRLGEGWQGDLPRPGAGADPTRGRTELRIQIQIGLREGLCGPAAVRAVVVVVGSTATGTGGCSTG
jgi:hypothetical protein